MVQCVERLLMVLVKFFVACGCVSISICACEKLSLFVSDAANKSLRRQVTIGFQSPAGDFEYS